MIRITDICLLALHLSLMADAQRETVATTSDYEFHHCPDQCDCSRAPECKDLKLCSSIMIWSYTCSGRGLKNVPNIGVNAYSIDLSHNNLTDLLGTRTTPNGDQYTVNIFAKQYYLKELNLRSNKITELFDELMISCIALASLDLSSNLFTTVPREALMHVGNTLTKLNIGKNMISDLQSNTFSELTRLTELILERNQIVKLPEDVFAGMQKLKFLFLGNNEIETFPAVALLPLKNLAELDLRHNKIKYLPDEAFHANTLLKVLELRGNPIQSVGQQAFINLPYLRDIILSEVEGLTMVPDLEKTNRVRYLRLDRCNIRTVSNDLCNQEPHLEQLDLHANQLSELPSLSNCSELHILNLHRNFITTIETNRFRALTKLTDLDLSVNSIKVIKTSAFNGLGNLKTLNLGHNGIHTIETDAFASLVYLEILILQNNSFPILPPKGLQRLLKLNTVGNPELQEFPTKTNFPEIHTLQLSYAYHCCPFMGLSQPDKEQADSTGNDPIIGEEVFFLKHPDYYSSNTSLHLDDYEDNHTYPDLLDYSVLQDYDETAASDNKAKEWTKQFEKSFDYQPKASNKHQVTCDPKPSPFMPCVDLMDWWTLRCGVWIVFLLAVIGNTIVMIVLISSRTKMNVPRFLICNLACADFLMGVYLGFLALVDASTLGNFRKYAFRWQMGSGCLTAGFLGTLASELSVFTLLVITLERLYAITNAMHLDRRLSLRHAGYVMLCGWTFAVILATLPLLKVEISDYRKFAICLPFEVSNTLSKAYVMFILIFNMASFVVILLCYTKIYWSIRGSQAWNSNDSRVARRMALLVFTDFACWAPIAVTAIAAALDKSLISLNEAKVFTVFVLPLNSCANPFLYAITTNQFKKDCMDICRRLDELTTVNKTRPSIISSLRQFTNFHSKRSSRGSHSSGILINPPGGIQMSGIPEAKQRKISDDMPDNETLLDGACKRSLSVPTLKDIADDASSSMCHSDQCACLQCRSRGILTRTNTERRHNTEQGNRRGRTRQSRCKNLHNAAGIGCKQIWHSERKSNGGRKGYRYNLVSNQNDNVDPLEDYVTGEANVDSQQLYLNATPEESVSPLNARSTQKTRIQPSDGATHNRCLAESNYYYSKANPREQNEIKEYNYSDLCLQDVECPYNIASADELKSKTISEYLYPLLPELPELRRNGPHAGKGEDMSDYYISDSPEYVIHNPGPVRNTYSNGNPVAVESKTEKQQTSLQAEVFENFHITELQDSYYIGPIPTFQAYQEPRKRAHTWNRMQRLENQISDNSKEWSWKRVRSLGHTTEMNNYEGSALLPQISTSGKPTVEDTTV